MKITIGFKCNETIIATKEFIWLHNDNNHWIKLFMVS